MCAVARLRSATVPAGRWPARPCVERETCAVAATASRASDRATGRRPSPRSLPGPGIAAAPIVTVEPLGRQAAPSDAVLVGPVVHAHDLDQITTAERGDHVRLRTTCAS